MKLTIYRLIGFVSRLLFPSYGCCGRCGRTWNICRSHITQIDKTTGIFPLCQSCWETLTPKQRAPYYFEVFFRWQAERYEHGSALLGDDVFKAIDRAVTNGK